VVCSVYTQAASASVLFIFGPASFILKAEGGRGKRTKLKGENAGIQLDDEMVPQRLDVKYAEWAV
jgi:hypothetical protein